MTNMGISSFLGASSLQTLKDTSQMIKKMNTQGVNSIVPKSSSFGSENNTPAMASGLGQLFAGLMGNNNITNSSSGLMQGLFAMMILMMIGNQK